MEVVFDIEAAGQWSVVIVMEVADHLMELAVHLMDVAGHLKEVASHH